MNSKIRSLITTFTVLLILAVITFGVTRLLGMKARARDTAATDNSPGLLHVTSTVTAETAFNSPLVREPINTPPTPFDFTKFTPPTPRPTPTMIPEIPYIPRERETPLPPIPTAAPTPIVTPYPVSRAPFISELANVKPEPFHIIIQNGNQVLRVSDDGKETEVLVDTFASFGYYLGHSPFEGFGSEGILPSWGNASPDGRHLALVLTDVWSRKDIANGKKFTLWIGVYDINSKELRIIDEGINPVWSPDGTRIAYTGVYKGLWIANPTTGEKWELAGLGEAYIYDNIIWSMDSQMIAAAKVEYEADYFNVVIDCNNNNSSIVLHRAASFLVSSWLPDDKTLLIAQVTNDPETKITFRDFWQIDTRNQVADKVSDGLSVISFRASQSYPGWVVFLGTIPYEISPEIYLYGKNDLWLYNYIDKKLVRITYNLGIIYDKVRINFSPDETQVIISQPSLGIRAFSLIDGSSRELWPSSDESYKAIDFTVIK